MNSTDGTASEIVARYFEMWNTGDSSVALEILSPDWTDHAHPEVTGPEGVRQAMSEIRAAQPGLRFHIETILGGGDLVAAVGHVGLGTGDGGRGNGGRGSRLIWLFRADDQGRMAEMWTYRDTTPPAGATTGSRA